METKFLQEEFDITYKALTLSERRKLFNNNNNFDHIDQVDFSGYLREQEWVRVLLESFDEFGNFNIAEHYINGFATAFHPFLAWAYKKIDLFIETIDERINKKTFLSEFLKGLSMDLMQFAQYSLILELHVAKLLNELDGNDPKERFASFINRISKLNNLRNFYSEYIVLAKIVTTRTIYNVNNTIVALCRYNKDSRIIKKELLNREDNVILEKITIGLGDRHNKGNTVMKLHFNSGNKIIYKPKELDIAVKFQNFSNIIAEKGLKIPFNFYKIIPRKGYGWEEVVEFNTCYTGEEIKRYFYRYGALLGISFILRGVDFHFENIIASGENPQMIDLETLFHNIPNMKIEEDAEYRASIAVSESVLGTNLLPLFMYKTDGHSGLELSGLSGGQQTTPFKFKQIENVNTDKMKVTKKTGQIMGGMNRPQLKNMEIDITNYSSDINEGFLDVMETFLNNKQYISENNLIDLFSNCKVRIVVRSTQKYTHLLNEANHPDYTRDLKEREQLLESLMNFPVENNSIMKAEIEDLLEGDIPYFTSYPNSSSLYDSENREIKNVFKETGIQLVKDRIKILTEESISYQANLIKASLLSISTGENSTENFTPIKFKRYGENTTKVLKEQLVEEAIKIGERLKNTAISSSEGVSWLGINLDSNGKYIVSEVRKDFYNGLSGISLFLSYLYKITKRNDFKELAIKSMNRAIHMEENNDFISSVFHGDTSLLYPLLHLKEVIGDDEMWIRKEGRILKNIEQKYKSVKDFDLLSGAAGTIILLTKMYEKIGDEKYLSIAVNYGNLLCKNAKSLGRAYTWESKTSKSPLGGFSHGSIGIAYSLHKLYALTKYNLFKDVGEGAIEFQRGLFRKNEKNWIDNREENKFCDTHWCNGAAGIGLGLLNIQSIKREMKIDEIIQTSIEKIVNKEVDSSFCLCHGTLGDAEFLLNSAIYFKREDWEIKAYEFVNQVLQMVKNTSNYFCGTKNNVETPGLFLGIAGIGYSFLRFSQPNIFPSLVSLDLPKTIK